jgi:hypothetical protein
MMMMISLFMFHMYNLRQYKVDPNANLLQTQIICSNVNDTNSTKINN